MGSKQLHTKGGREGIGVGRGERDDASVGTKEWASNAPSAA